MRMTLNGVADISQAASTLLIAGGLLYASRQVTALREQVADGARVRRLQATHDFLEIIAVDEVRATRRWLLSTPASAHSAIDRHEPILRLAVAYDRIGLLIAHQLLDSDLVFQWQGPEIVRLWELVRDKVLAERKLDGRHQYCIYFERMVMSFMRHQTPSPEAPQPALALK
jgi:hypothetical protein